MSIHLHVLREFVHVKQEQGGGRRRWFESDALELIVWQDSTGRMEGFQICYQFNRRERALTWRPQVGFAHHFIDTGTRTPFGGRMTPILIPDGPVPWTLIEERFAAECSSLEPELRELVASRLVAKM